MKSLDHIFKLKVSKKYLRKKANKRIKEEKIRLKNVGLLGDALDERIKTIRLTEMKKVDDGRLTGWRIIRKSQKNDMRKYLIYNGRLKGIVIQKINFNLPRSVKTHEDFTRYVLRQNLFAEIFTELQQYEGKRSFPCFLFAENWASISKDNNGIFHYFTNRPNGSSVSLNVFDLFEIICSKEGESFAVHRRILIQILGCSYSEHKWEMKQMNKVQINNDNIQNAKIDWHNQYHSLLKLTQSYLDILLKIITHSEKHVISKRYSYKNESLFYVSSRYLGDALNRDPSNVRRAVNMFACLGLIEKVPPTIEGFPLEFLKSAMKIRGNIDNYKLVTFFIIPQYTKKLLRIAEAKAQKLLKNKITNITKLNEKTMTAVFGENYAKSVYFVKEIDIQQLVKQSKVDLSKCKQADTFRSKREIERLESQPGTFGNDMLPF
ncbi:hypothetical protein [Neobacillus citreus]|uniref:Uncharacterized protein n=1 Tax=Neobacillus citreus TaxID=2833578 RepID=A0A942YEP4_9BACI|nr:hypothetical protein [Neobacillus citreus]MCH6265094.1 hypothetical protein [Neobacillus citreus]